MARSEVYSWRVAAELKAALEDAAREEKTSVGELLGRMARQWLRDRASGAGESESVQQRIRASSERFVGSLAGGNPRRAESARREIRERLAKRRAS
jgi:nucleotidyltransferase/DNA polymerase involved in DNA repair